MAVHPTKPEKRSFASAFKMALFSFASWSVLVFLVAWYYADPEKVPIGQPAESTDNEQAPTFNEWSSGVCACCNDCEISLCAFCCPQIRWAFTISLVPRMLTFWAAFAAIYLTLTSQYVLDGAKGELARNTLEISVWKNHTSHADLFKTITADLNDLRRTQLWAITGHIQSISFIMAVLLGMFYRQKLRTVFRMQTGGMTLVTDFLLYCFCSCCTIAQEARHVKAARTAGHDAFKEVG
jgi:Cys-rich protein (TIGR01571 family)